MTQLDLLARVLLGGVYVDLTLHQGNARARASVDAYGDFGAVHSMAASAYIKSRGDEHLKTVVADKRERRLALVYAAERQAAARLGRGRAPRSVGPHGPGARVPREHEPTRGDRLSILMERDLRRVYSWAFPGASRYLSPRGLLVMSAEVMEGAIFAGRYRLIRRLATGAMGAVYEARHLGTDRRLALKVMLSHIIERPELRRRFELEARITAHIESPFLVEVFDAGVDEATGVPFLVMELLRGEELGRCLRRVGRFSFEETLACLHQTALALDKTHAAGIVHRDLKPANLFLSVREGGDRRIKILDFGVAKIVAEGTARGGATQTVGTPLYMAPEQFRGQRVSAATDIYALGMMAYAFLVGEAYWADERTEEDNLVAFALSAAYGPVESAMERASRKGVLLPAGFDVWFAKVTAVDPDERFATATAAVRALGDALGIVEMGALALPDPALLHEPSAAETRAATAGDGGLEDGGAGQGSEAIALGETEPASQKGSTLGDSTPEIGSRGLTRDEGSAIPIERAAPAPTPLAPGRPRVWGVRAITGGLILAVVGAWFVHRNAPSAPLPPPAPLVVSPLQSTSSVLGCPVFEASGIDEPSGWMGAAAASLFCDRASVLLGGSATRTLAPAELLALPAQPVDRFPEDPYAAPDTRAKSIDAARRRAAAYADGQVVRENTGFRITVTLRRPDGADLDHAVGTGRSLYEALRGAMNPLAERGALPVAATLDATMADFSRARDVGGALALFDLAAAMSNNAGGLPDECSRVAARSADLAELGPAEARHCAYTLGLPLPEVRLSPRGDMASPGELAARARVEHVVRRVDDPASIAELERRFAHETTPRGRSTLATTLSCLLQSGDPKRAAEMSLLAVAAEPRNPIGEGCAPWLQLLAVTYGTTSAEASLRAMQAWVPWNSYGWLYQAKRLGDKHNALTYARRAYVLSPLDMSVAGTLADTLLTSGAREEARGIALALATGGAPVHRVASDLLLVRIEASEARLGAALARAKRAMVVSADDAGWQRVQRFEIAWRALQIALVLGRAQEIADLVVERFLEPEPPPLDGAYLDVPLRLPAICAHASPAVSRRCFTRFRELRQRLSYSALPDADAFTDGAERYAKGDFAGAARAFRPLLRTPGPFVEVLAEPMIETFEQTGESELVARLEAALADRSAELNGASLALVRAARRAAKQGDGDRARALANRVLEAWSVADETVPAVAEMRLLAQEGRRAAR
ncbi:serine/threonine-protein kinase [Polyangium sp. 6x1]|uniref:serine/threonine-protein kinase n=1 Tax=Polyangium sp. 6x1 TaxID=3042689 RepID=UPI002482B6E3|nr:serine/threonine-protein kinase [Polyangium sp. 6x1]MDI1447442.1 serine/threonine-protein kinase [Polyangium sp. 6x1]